MKIELEINDIISQEELKEIARETIISNMKYRIEKETDRLLGNMAWYKYESFCDAIFTEEQKELTRTKITALLNNLSESSVFHKSYWARDPNSQAYDIMQKCVYENKEKIEQQTIKILENYNYEEKLDNDCMGILHDSIIKKLSHKCED